MSILPVSNKMSYDPYENIWEKKRRPESIDGRVDAIIGKLDSSTSSEQEYEYMKSEKSTNISSGIYKIERDGNGGLKVIFADAASNVTDSRAGAEDNTDEKEVQAGSIDTAAQETVKTTNGKRAQTHVSEDTIPKKAGETEECSCNTDKVDDEIKSLKEEKRQIEQQIKNANGDEKKITKLKKRLADIVAELTMKNSDSYRKQNASYSYN